MTTPLALFESDRPSLDNDRPIQQAAAETRPAVVEMSLEELQQWLIERGQPSWRARQIHHHLFHRGVTTYAEMTDLPAALRQMLREQLPLFTATPLLQRRSSDGTHKLLLQLKDQRSIECVLIPDQNRVTACISTQVGCGMGCVFCASGLNGLERNLSVGEMLEQLLRLNSCAGRRLTHIVVMGMGEPLANLDNLLKALEIACDPRQGLGLSQRHVTISTVGLPSKIRRLADSGRHYHLAVSLHAPNDALRNRIVPTNRKTGIAAIVEAADYFFARTGRQVTYEYVLLGEVNDTAGCARELTQLLAGRKAHVNLIPWNEVPGLPYRPPRPEAVLRMVRTLRHAGISVKVRKRRGADIEAACGQLRRQTFPTPQAAAPAGDHPPSSAPSLDGPAIPPTGAPPQGCPHPPDEV
jgi:23S rRNA (adenine2503-C2)-methyltransferase